MTYKLKISFALLLFHRSHLIGINQAITTLGSFGIEELDENIVERGGIRFHSTGEWVATKCAEAHHPLLWFFVFFEREPIVIHHDECVTALHNGPWCRKVERDHWNLFEEDVVPHIKLCPVT